jgi:hypothetical protein
MALFPFLPLTLKRVLLNVLISKGRDYWTRKLVYRTARVEDLSVFLAYGEQWDIITDDTISMFTPTYV